MNIVNNLKNFLLASTLLIPLKLQADITLGWEPSPSIDISDYLVYVQEVGGATTRYGALTNAQADGTIIRNISGLKNNAVYRFFVTARDSNKQESEPSNTILSVNLNYPQGSTNKNNTTEYLIRPDDVLPPTLIFTNTPALSDYIQLSTNYSKGTLQNPFLTKTGYITLEGIVSDDKTFISSLKFQSQNSTNLEISYKAEGGPFRITSYFPQQGTNEFYISQTDFAGNTETNKFYIINTKNQSFSDQNYNPLLHLSVNLDGQKFISFNTYNIGTYTIQGTIDLKNWEYIFSTNSILEQTIKFTPEDKTYPFEFYKLLTPINNP